MGGLKVFLYDLSAHLMGADVIDYSKLKKVGA